MNSVKTSLTAVRLFCPLLRCVKPNATCCSSIQECEWWRRKGLPTEDSEPLVVILPKKPVVNHGPALDRVS